MQKQIHNLSTQNANKMFKVRCIQNPSLHYSKTKKFRKTLVWISHIIARFLTSFFSIVLAMSLGPRKVLIIFTCEMIFRFGDVSFIQAQEPKWYAWRTMGITKGQWAMTKQTMRDNGILFCFVFQKLQVRGGHHENINAWGGHIITLRACWRTLTNVEKMLGVSSRIQKMLKDIKNIFSICFWVTRGCQKDTKGWGDENASGKH